MKVQGVVTRVRALGEDGQISVVSIEGFSVLCRGSDGVVPGRGMEIRGRVQVHWKKDGGRPTFWLSEWKQLEL